MVGMVQARQVLTLLDWVKTLQQLNESLCERVAAQSALLSRKAEKVTHE